jgi:hypothetical protein
LRIAERDNALILGDAAADALESLKEKAKEGTEAKIQKVTSLECKNQQQTVN